MKRPRAFRRWPVSRSTVTSERRCRSAHSRTIVALVVITLRPSGIPWAERDGWATSRAPDWSMRQPHGALRGGYPPATRGLVAAWMHRRVTWTPRAWLLVLLVGATDLRRAAIVSLRALRDLAR